LSLPTFHPTPERELELKRLGDEIAELAAHLDAATARLLELIRKFDAEGGWGNGCAATRSWFTSTRRCSPTLTHPVSRSSRARASRRKRRSAWRAMRAG
jgi:hypothetical protein